MPGKWPLFRLNKSVFEPCIHFSFPHLVRNESELPGLTEHVHSFKVEIMPCISTQRGRRRTPCPSPSLQIRSSYRGRYWLANAKLVSLQVSSVQACRPSSPDTMIEHIMQSFSQSVEVLQHETWFWWQTQPRICPSSRFFSSGHGDEFEIESTGS